MGVVSGRQFGAGRLRAEIVGELHSTIRLCGALRPGLRARLAGRDSELRQAAFESAFGAPPSAGKSQKPYARRRRSEFDTGRITTRTFIYTATSHRAPPP